MANFIVQTVRTAGARGFIGLTVLAQGSVGGGESYWFELFVRSTTKFDASGSFMI